MMGVLYCIIAMAQPITGGALNSTICLCAMTFRVMATGDTSTLKYLTGYFFGPLLSGALAGIYIRYFAIKVTPAAPGHTGSPFLAPRIRKTLNDSSRNTVSGRLNDVSESPMSNRDNSSLKA